MSLPGMGRAWHVKGSGNGSSLSPRFYTASRGAPVGCWGHVPHRTAEPSPLSKCIRLYLKISEIVRSVRSVGHVAGGESVRYA